MPKRKHIQISITLPTELLERLRSRHSATGLKVSRLIALACTSYLDGLILPGNRTLALPGLANQPSSPPSLSTAQTTAMSSDQFDLLIGMLRLSEPIKQAAYMVLIDGRTQAMAARENGIGHRQAVYRAVRKIQALQDVVGLQQL
jgi:TrfB plasmid transcriptional repressor